MPYAVPDLPEPTGFPTGSTMMDREWVQADPKGKNGGKT